MRHGCGDSHTTQKTQTANFFTNSLALVIVWAAFATKGKKGSRSLLPVPNAAFTKGFQLGDDRNNCGWIFHNLVHVGNGQTTSSFDIWSLRRRESTRSIQPRQLNPHLHKKCGGVLAEAARDTTVEVKTLVRVPCGRVVRLAVVRWGSGQKKTNTPVPKVCLLTEKMTARIKYRKHTTSSKYRCRTLVCNRIWFAHELSTVMTPTMKPLSQCDEKKTHLTSHVIGRVP